MMETAVARVDAAVKPLLGRRSRLVLAVSGGLDSVVLLDAVSRLRQPRHHVVVATVDHGTGAHATRAAAATAASASRLGLPVVTERLARGARGEAAWRAGRWRFLRTIAARERAVIVTAHTLDDQLETVVMRQLRGSAARGLAGLYAASTVERPLLHLRRSDLVEYATRRALRYVDDPTNRSTAFLRNRVRLNLLPAIRAVCPTFERDLIDLARRAARLREEVDEIAATVVLDEHPLRVDLQGMADLDLAGRLVLWPAVIARIGVPLDRRGLLRLCHLVDKAVGSSAQVSGGLEAVVGRSDLLIRRLLPPRPMEGRPLRGTVRFGDFHFTEGVTRTSEAALARDGDRGGRGGDPAAESSWRMYIPSTAKPVVREWVAGDRLTLDSKGSKRRVKRFLADAGIPGPLRRGWPVVAVGDDIVWIPGIRACPGALRGDSTMIEYRCERVLE